ncbi:MAG: Crp/Fnr family transcriptional regulator [Bacteroidaceae bacterium]|nr:Crp/Fnr family transcriptional regulator [Bacteroidaceae bacterium]
MEKTMFDTLLDLPLFQGLGHDDLNRILESTHLYFEKRSSGDVIVKEGDLCEDVTFVLDGKVSVENTAADGSWSVEEEIHTSSAIGIECLYGSRRTYPSTYKAHSQTRLLRIDKRTIAALTAYFEVFRINLLNYLSAVLARTVQPHWLPAPETLEGRIVMWLRSHVSRPAGYKQFHLTMTVLGRYLGEDYRYISRALHKLEDSGLLILSRHTITIPAFEALLLHKQL